MKNLIKFMNINFTLAVVMAVGLVTFPFAYAQSWNAVFDWTADNTREDGNVLTAAEFIRWDIVCARAGNVATVTDFAQRQHTVSNWSFGTDTCYMLTWATKYDNLTGELASQPSVSVQVIIPKLLANPNAPTGVTVTVVSGGGLP